MTGIQTTNPAATTFPTPPARYDVSNESRFRRQLEQVLLRMATSVQSTTGSLAAHASQHEAGGADALDLGNLAGSLTYAQHGDLSGLGSAHDYLDITGTLPEAQVTQHEAALTILESQITDGAILARVAASETISGAWTFYTGAATALTVGDDAASTAQDVVLNAAATNHRRIWWRTAGVNRWAVRVTTDAEGGSEAGADLTIARYTDAGTFVENVLLISRATGLATFSADLNIGGTLARRNTATSYIEVTGGNATDSGANVKLFGGSHATQASDILLRTGGTPRLTWDHSATTWYFGNYAATEAVQTGALTANGNVTLDIGSGTFRIQNGATIEFEVDGSTGDIGVGATPEDDVGLLLDTPARAITANAEYDRLYVKASGAVTVTNATTSALVTTARFDEPGIVLAGTGAVTDAATVWISGAPTEGSNNYALRVVSGLTGLGGNLNVAGLATITRTSEQLRLAYDGSNYASLTMNGGGALQLDVTGFANQFTVTPYFTVSNQVLITSTSTPQLEVRYNGSNYLRVTVASDGDVTFAATGTGSDEHFEFSQRVAIGTSADSWTNLHTNRTPAVSGGLAAEVYVDSQVNAEANSNTLYGQYINSRLLMRSFTGVTAYGLRVGYQLSDPFTESGTYGTVYGIRVAPTISGVTISTLYGLYLDAVSAASTNYAIYTNAGTVRLGGDLMHAGSNVGFYGTTPVAQASAITKPTGGTTVDTQARTAIDAIIDAIGAASGVGITA